MDCWLVDAWRGQCLCRCPRIRFLIRPHTPVSWDGRCWQRPPHVTCTRYLNHRDRSTPFTSSGQLFFISTSACSLAFHLLLYHSTPFLCSQWQKCRNAPLCSLTYSCSKSRSELAAAGRRHFLMGNRGTSQGYGLHRRIDPWLKPGERFLSRGLQKWRR